MKDVTFVGEVLNRHSNRISCNIYKSTTMNSQQHHYSPFSPSVRKWMITIGGLVLVATVFYALSTGVVSYLNY